MNTAMQLDSSKTFWDMTEFVKASEKYKIDRNLQYLAIAPLEHLKKIFIQYRYFTHYYITDLALLISKLPFGKLRSILAEILYEELGNGDQHDAHPALYDEFLVSIGIARDELERPDLNCLRNLKEIQSALINNTWAYAVGLRGMGGECLCQIYLSTMYDYFSKNPAITAIKDQIAWKFWDIHTGEADLHHQRIMRDAIDELVFQQPETIDDLVTGYQQSKQAWDNFWEQIFNASRKNNEYKRTN
jgi:hypothetical protein